MNLLSWLGREVKGGAQTVNRDVIHPATHNVATNLVGNYLVKPVAQQAGQFGVDASNQLYNHLVAPALNLPKQNLQTGTALNPIVGKLQHATNANGTLGQTLSSGAITGLNIAAPGSSKFVTGTAERFLPKAVPKLIPKIVSSSVVGSQIGGLSNTANYLGNSPKLTPGGLIKAYGQGAGAGAIGGAAFPIAGKGIGLGAKGASKVLKNAPKVLPKPQTLNEAGFAKVPSKSETLYHGTPNKIDIPTTMSQEGGNQALFFTSDKKYAQNYAAGNRTMLQLDNPKGGTVITAKLKNNTKILDASGTYDNNKWHTPSDAEWQKINQLAQQRGVEINPGYYLSPSGKLTWEAMLDNGPGASSGLSNPIVKIIKDLGYDGIKTTEMAGEKPVHIIFNPKALNYTQSKLKPLNEVGATGKNVNKVEALRQQNLNQPGLSRADQLNNAMVAAQEATKLKQPTSLPQNGVTENLDSHTLRNKLIAAKSGIKPVKNGYVHYTDTKPVISTNSNRLIPNSMSLQEGKGFAAVFGRNKFHVQLNDNAKIFNVGKTEWDKIASQLPDSATNANIGAAIGKYAKDNGYDAVRIDRSVNQPGLGTEVAVFNKNAIKSTNQIGLKKLNQGGYAQLPGKDNKIADKAYQQTVKNGGVTIRTESGRQPHQGIAFSPFKDTEQVIDSKKFTPDVVNSYMAKHADKLSQPGNHLGIWEDKGKTYLDISQVGDKSPSTLQKAMDAQQLAAFDLGNFQEIPLGKINKGVYNSTYEASNHPYLNQEQVGSASSPRVASEPAKVSKQEVKLPGASGPKQNPSGSLPNSTPKGAIPAPVKPRGFGETVKSSRLTSPELKATLAGKTLSYTPKTNKALISQARGLIGKDYEKAHQIATTEASDRGVAIATELIKLHQQRGEYNLAADIADKAAANLTDLGRGVQAASLYSRLSPEGIVRYAARQAQKSGNKLGPDVTQQLTQMAQEISKMPDGEAKAVAVHKILQLAKSQNVSSLSEKIITLWKAGLLTGPRTHTGNILSNAIETGTRQGLINPVATVVDKATSLFTGNRSRSLTFKGGASGFGEGLSHSKTYIKTGYDPRNPLSKYDLQKVVTFGNGKLGKAATGYTEGVFRILGGADQPFYYSNFRNSLYDHAITAAKNQGLKGGTRKTFVENFVKEPPTDALNGAVEDAWRSVWGNETILGNIATKAKQPFSMKVAGKEVKYSGAVGNFVIPFTKVPASIATRIVERSPLGFVRPAKQIVQAMQGKGFDQRQFTESLANAAVGSTVALSVGAELANHNMITLGYPTDPKERKLWELEGKRPYSIKIGNKWLSMNYVQPFGSMLAYGAAYSQSRKGGDPIIAAISKSAAEAAKAVTGQSFLKGLSGSLQAIQDPEKSAETFVQQTAGSIVPNFAQSVVTASDKNQRVVKSPLDALKNDIPGLRETLPVKTDVFGQPIPRPSGAISTIANPLNPSDVRNQNDGTVQELRRLQDAQYGIIPTQFNKATFDTTTYGNVKLTTPQIKNLQDKYGQAIKPVWDSIIQDPRYQSLTDEEKQRVLSNASSTVSDVIKRQFAVDNGVPINKAAPKKTQEFASGNNVDFFSSTQSSSGTTGNSSNPSIPKQTTTTYDPTTNTWTQVNHTTGRVTLIDASGKRTVLQSGTSTAKAKGSGGSKTAGKTSLTKYLSVLKATNAVIKPPKAPSIPKFSVKSPTYKTSLKKYAISKPKITKSTKVKVA